MDPRRLREVLERVQRSELSVDDATQALRQLPFEDLGFAQVDHHRAIRLGFPEVVLGQFKSVHQIAEISRSIARGGGNVLVTRVDPEKGAALQAVYPELRHDPASRTSVIEQTPPALRGRGPIAVVTAGTSDLHVAEE